MTEIVAPRRLLDKLLAAFEQACDQEAVEVARALHVALALAAQAEPPDGIERRGPEQEALVQRAYDRLRMLQQEK